MSFKQLLQRLEQELEVPYPERRQILDEIEGHLEALHADAVAAGASEAEAAERALTTMALDGDFVASMAEVHRPAVARVLARLPPRVSLGIEYGSIALIGLLLLLSVLTREAKMIAFFRDGGLFMIPLNIAGLAIVCLFIERAYSLYLKRDHSRANLGRRMLSFRFLAVACALTGIVGTLTGFFHAFSVADQVMARHGGVFPIYEVARVAMTTSIWGMTLSLLAVIAQFVVKAKVARIGELQLS